MISAMKDDTTSGDYSRHHEKKVPVIEEQVQVNIRSEETGKVRAVKKVHEEDFIVSGEASDQEVHIERVSMNRDLMTKRLII